MGEGCNDMELENRTYFNRAGHEITFYVREREVEAKMNREHHWCSAESPNRPNVSAAGGFTFYVRRLGKGEIYYYGDGPWVGRVYDETRKDSDIQDGDLIVVEDYRQEQLSLFD